MAIRPKATSNAADALREVPPREFVRARKALAAQLAKNGRTAEAREISRLRRPSPVVWALNKASAARPRELRILLEGVDRLRRAQLGQRDPRAATEHYRASFEPIVQAASEALQNARTSRSAALERRLRSTLLAAATDRRLRADLMAGRLTDEQTDPGFAVLSQGVIPAELLRDRPAKLRPAPAAPPGGRLTRQASRDARQAARKAKREARTLEQEARRKERAAQVAETEVAALQKALREREQRSVALRSAADEARHAHEKAEAAARAAERAD